MTQLELSQSPVDASTLWRMVVGERPLEGMVLSLDRLGSPTKPTFLCQLRHHGHKGNSEMGTALTFFLLADHEPTQAINATVSLGRALEGTFARLGWDKGREQALKVQTAMAKMGQNWTHILALCMSLEHENGVYSRVK